MTSKPANIYLFKVTIKTLQKGVKLVDDVVLLLLLLTLNIFHTFFSSVSIVDFEQVNVSLGSSSTIIKLITIFTSVNFNVTKNCRVHQKAAHTKG